MDASIPQPPLVSLLVFFLAAVPALVMGCSGETAATSVPTGAPSVDLVAPPPGIADRGDDPAVVAIDVGTEPPCAGALVAADVVLTARHCVVAGAAPPCAGPDAASTMPALRPPESLHVFVGDDMATALERARGRAILVPTDAECADIAILLLDEAIDDVQPLVVRSTGAAQGDHLRTVGWRLAAPAGRGQKVLRDHLPVLGASSTELQIAEAAASGGGPALDEATAEVLGIFSRAAEPSLSIYTRADAFLTLIEGALAQSDVASASTRGQKKPKKGSADLGANCAAGADCAAGACVSVPAEPGGATSAPQGEYCSQTCGARDRCPARFRCQRTQGGVEVCTET
jgi:hypothetical protein